MSRKVKIKQIKSTIKRLESQKRTLEALGLRKIGLEVEHELSPSINGMINKVKHLVRTYCRTYTKNEEWIDKINKSYEMGITKSAFQQLGELSFLNERVNKEEILFFAIENGAEEVIEEKSSFRICKSFELLRVVIGLGLEDLGGELAGFLVTWLLLLVLARQISCIVVDA